MSLVSLPNWAFEHLQNSAHFYELEVAEVFGIKRQRAICHARHRTFYLAYLHRPAATLQSIADAYGVSHCTIRNGIRSHCSRNELALPKALGQGVSKI